MTDPGRVGGTTNRQTYIQDKEPLTSSVRQALSRRQTVRPLAFNCVLIATGYWTNAMRTYARLRSGANSGPAQNSPPLPISPPSHGARRQSPSGDRRPPRNSSGAGLRRISDYYSYTCSSSIACAVCMQQTVASQRWCGRRRLSLKTAVTRQPQPTALYT